MPYRGKTHGKALENAMAGFYEAIGANFRGIRKGLKSEAGGD